VFPVLALVTVVKVVENSTDYSLQNTIQQALFLPTSREAKYKAKAAIDTLFVRLGDLASTGIVAAGAALGAGLSSFVLVNLLASVAWVLVVVRLARRYRNGAASTSRVAADAPASVRPAAAGGGS